MLLPPESAAPTSAESAAVWLLAVRPAPEQQQMVVEMFGDMSAPIISALKIPQVFEIKVWRLTCRLKLLFFENKSKALI